MYNITDNNRVQHLSFIRNVFILSNPAPLKHFVSQKTWLIHKYSFVLVRLCFVCLLFLFACLFVFVCLFVCFLLLVCFVCLCFAILFLFFCFVFVFLLLLLLLLLLFCFVCLFVFIKCFLRTYYSNRCA